jgi:hypothetical protein
MTNPTDAVAVADKATAQVREFGDRAAGTTRELGKLALDAYEKAVASYVEFEQRAAEAAPVDWVKAAIGAHASFVQDINGAYVKAVREALN